MKFVKPSNIKILLDIRSVAVKTYCNFHRSSKTVVFNLGSRTPKGAVNHFWRGLEYIFYTRSCITFVLFEFKWRWGPFRL